MSTPSELPRQGDAFESITTGADQSLRSFYVRNRLWLEQRIYMSGQTHEALPSLDFKWIRCQDENTHLGLVLHFIDHVRHTQEPHNLGPFFVLPDLPCYRTPVVRGATGGDRFFGEHRICVQDRFRLAHRWNGKAFITVPATFRSGLYLHASEGWQKPKASAGELSIPTQVAAAPFFMNVSASVVQFGT